MDSLDRIKEEVSIFDLFDASTPPVRYMTKGKPSQISCPFHGADARPSARVYPDTNSFRCFTCSKSWNAVTYWAEANQWFTESGKLDIGRSIDDLCNRYNISNTFSAWEKKFYALRNEDERGTEAPVEDRKKLAIFYAWRAARLVHQLPFDERDSRREGILNLWESYDSIDITADSWSEDLKNWYTSAKLVVNARGL